MKYKEFGIKEDTGGGNGGFTGYAATFDREPDSYGDVIAAGAFAETLEKWKAAGKPIPLLYGHNMGDPDYNIGTVELAEDETGLLCTASYDSSPKAQRVRELVREGRLYKMSFAFDVLDEGTVELEDGTKANELRKLEIYEVSVVLVPANQHAEIIEAKSRSKYGRTISKATGDELAAVLEALQEIADKAHGAAEALSALIPDEQHDDGSDEGGTGEDPSGNPDGKSVDAMVDKIISLIY